jgi:hypothetical protein
MSDKPLDAEACDIAGQASATNVSTDATNGLSDRKNAPCNRPLKDYILLYFRHQILVGVRDVTMILNANTSVYKIEEFKVHPEYNSPAAYHDVAILELNR